MLMDPLKKREMLKTVKNEYLAAILAAKVARRLHAMAPEDRPDPNAKVTSLAIKMVTDGDVEFDIALEHRVVPTKEEGGAS
jgi:DNA-directed RNA polymerase subunit K/omega